MVVQTIDENGSVKYIELKGWGKEVEREVDGKTITYGAHTWFSKQLKNPGSQIYKDIILFVRENNKLGIGAYEGVQWYIKKEGFDAIQKNAIDGDIYQELASSLRYNKGLLRGAFNPDEVEDWDEFQENLIEIMKANEFFKAVD